LDLGHLFDVPPTDCSAYSEGPWRVDIAADELRAGDSRRGSVKPGLPVECSASLTTVTWSVQDPSVASILQLGARNAANDTAGDISRAWVTGLSPGLATVSARVVGSDGIGRDAQSATIRVVEPPPPPRGSFVVAEGTTNVTFNEFTGGGASPLIPFTLPRSGSIELTLDWISLANSLSIVLWEGDCSAVPCPGRLLLNSSGFVKPRREVIDSAAAGAYTLRALASGSGIEEAQYEVRLTPD